MREHTKNVPLPNSPNKILDKSVKGFLSSDWPDIQTEPDKQRLLLYVYTITILGILSKDMKESNES